MIMKTGCPMHIVARIPHQGKLAKGCGRGLSPRARFRLGVIDWHNQVSKLKSGSGKKNVSFTCRRFGIDRSYFYRWQGRLKRHRLEGLEDRSRRPLNVRREMTGSEVMEEIRRIRRRNPTYSAKKIHPILLRLYEEREVPSVSTVSNIIKRHNLFFRADTRAFKRCSGSAMRAAAGRRRVKESLRASGPNKVVEFDMKHIRLPLCGRRYALVG